MAKFKYYSVESEGNGIGVSLSTMNKIRRPLKKVCDNHSFFPWSIGARLEAENEVRLRKKIFLELMERRFEVKPECRLGRECAYQQEGLTQFMREWGYNQHITVEYVFGDVDVITIWNTSMYCDNDLYRDTYEILYNGEKIGEIVLKVRTERT